MQAKIFCVNNKWSSSSNSSSSSSSNAISRRNTSIDIGIINGETYGQMFSSGGYQRRLVAHRYGLFNSTVTAGSEQESIELLMPWLLRCQDINTHDTDYEEHVSTCLTWGRISTVNKNYLCHICMFLFLLKYLAHKGWNIDEMGPFYFVNWPRNVSLSIPLLSLHCFT